MSDFLLVEQAPTVDEYQMLRVAVGWGEADAQATQSSIDNSLYWVCVHQG